MPTVPPTPQATRLAVDVAKNVKLSDAATKLLTPALTPRQFFAALADVPTLADDAIRFLAMALPKREAVLWGLICVKGARPKPADGVAVKAVARRGGVGEGSVRSESPSRGGGRECRGLRNGSRFARRGCVLVRREYCSTAFSRRAAEGRAHGRRRGGCGPPGIVNCVEWPGTREGEVRRDWRGGRVGEGEGGVGKSATLTPRISPRGPAGGASGNACQWSPWSSLTQTPPVVEPIARRLPVSSIASAWR